MSGKLLRRCGAASFAFSLVSTGGLVEHSSHASSPNGGAIARAAASAPEAGEASMPGADAAATMPLEAEARGALEALRREPRTSARLVRETELLHHLSRWSAEKPARESLVREAASVSEEALAASPEDPAAVLWWAAAQGQLAAVERNLQALKRLKEIRARLEKLREANPHYGGAAADRALAQLYRNAPGLISFGSNSKAREYFEQALKIAPEHPANLIYYADFLAGGSERERARAMAQRALAALEREPAGFDRRAMSDTAAALLQRIQARD